MRRRWATVLGATRLASMVALSAVTAWACGGISRDAGGTSPDPLDAGPLPPLDGSTTPPGPESNIRHVVIVIQENHTFDAYFGRYCTAPTGSNPTCTDGPKCCEAAPATDPSGSTPVTLDDVENAQYDPNHTQLCELSEMNAGHMDRYVTGAACSNPKNFAIATPAVVKTYQGWAAQYALADRYFQPIVGQSSSNDMYFATAKYVFTDNTEEPNTIGHGCSINRTTVLFTGQTTLGDVLLGAGKGFAFYAEGYDVMKSVPFCPPPPSDCPANLQIAPCVYDPSDVPFEYYKQFADDPHTMRDFSALATDIQGGTLPSVVYVKGLGYKTEHPGYGTTISTGAAFVKGVVDSVMGSAYANDTLVLVTWDEGGGFFDHVKPPPTRPEDGQAYGTRVPLLAIGRFARKNQVSHVVMEHSSIVKFLELVFTGQTGQLGARDAHVANIGSLLDPTTTGLVVPED